MHRPFLSCRGRSTPKFVARTARSTIWCGNKSQSVVVCSVRNKFCCHDAGVRRRSLCSHVPAVPLVRRRTNRNQKLWPFLLSESFTAGHAPSNSTTLRLPRVPLGENTADTSRADTIQQRLNREESDCLAFRSRDGSPALAHSAFSTSTAIQHLVRLAFLLERALQTHSELILFSRSTVESRATALPFDPAPCLQRSHIQLLVHQLPQISSQQYIMTIYDDLP